MNSEYHILKRPDERVDVFAKNINSYRRLLHLYRYSLVKKFAYGKFLDAGCGTGSLLKFLPPEVEYYGIDISVQAVETAQKNSPGKGHFFLYDGKSIPFPDDFFDTVGCLEVIEHLSQDEQGQYLEEIKRIIRPEGIVVISTPNRNYPVKLIKKKIFKWNNPFHKHEFPVSRFLDFLKQHSLRIVETVYIGDPLNVFGNVFMQKTFRAYPGFQKYLFRCSLLAGRLFKNSCSDVLAVCEKTDSAISGESS